MSDTARAAALLEDIAVILELLGEDRFRVAAYQRAARALDACTEPLQSLAQDRDALLRIQGIGPKTADKIIEFARTGRIAEHDELAARVPQGVRDLLSIPGLGPKTVSALWKQLGVTSRDDLRRVIDDGSILSLPRMGTKTVENIKEALAFSEQAAERIPLGVALPIARAIVDTLSAVPGTARCTWAGSLRRGRDTIGDIDILAAADDPAPLHHAFTSLPGVEKVLASGSTKSSVRFRPPDRDDLPPVQIDLRTLDPAAWGAGLMYFTGSKEHNVRLRERAIRMGFTLNEYGLFPADDDPAPPQTRGVAPVAADSEPAVYAALDLPFIPPEIREDRGELECTQTPRLLQTDDIRAELHAHTTASDGSLSLDQLVALARDRGFHTIAVTDHSRSAVQANGLSEERLLQQIELVRNADAHAKGIRVLAGAEVDILADGRLDYDDDLLARLDIVVASPHTALSQSPAQATRRLIRAIEHPLVNILGHPTGRIIGRRKGLEPAIDEIVAAAREHNVALEINAHWLRLDLRDAHVRAAVDAGCLIAVNCDVHSPDDFDHITYGVLTARRGWCTPDRCVNTWPRRRLDDWLRSRR